MLKPEYHCQGYWLYVPLFIATAVGMGACVLQPFAGVTSLRNIFPRLLGRLAGVVATGFALFTIVAVVMIVKSNLILIGK